MTAARRCRSSPRPRTIISRPLARRCSPAVAGPMAIAWRRSWDRHSPRRSTATSRIHELLECGRRHLAHPAGTPEPPSGSHDQNRCFDHCATEPSSPEADQVEVGQDLGPESIEPASKDPCLQYTGRSIVSAKDSATPIHDNLPELSPGFKTGVGL